MLGLGSLFKNKIKSIVGGGSSYTRVLSLSQASFSLSPAQVDGSFTYDVLTIENTGTGSLSIYGFSSDNEAFSVSPATSIIPSGETRQFLVVFRPKDDILNEATVTISSNKTDGDDSFTASATGTASRLVKDWDFSGVADTPAVGANTELYDGLIDIVGSTFSVASGKLLNSVGNPRVNWLKLGNYTLRNVKTELYFNGDDINGTELIQSVQKGNVASGPYTGLRSWISKGTTGNDSSLIVNSSIITEVDLTPNAVNYENVLKDYVLRSFAFQNAGVNSAYCAVYDITDLDTKLQYGNAAVDTNNAAILGERSAFVSGFNTTKLQKIELYNASPLYARLPYQGTSAVVLGYVGSSTWDSTVPASIETEIEGQYPTANIATVNGAVGGATTSTFLSGQAAMTAFASAFSAATGYKVARLMIGSNDAKNGVTTATWLTNMADIISSVRSAGADVIILEEIGLREDGGEPTKTLIKEYNAARYSLLDEDVYLGYATTYQDQIDQGTLDVDTIHQTTRGKAILAAHQAIEVFRLFDEQPATPEFYDISVSPESLAFSNVVPPSTKDLTVRVTNNGLFSVSLTGVTLATGFTIDIDNYTLPAGEYVDLTVTFTPELDGVYSTNIVLSFDMVDDISIPVTGTGYAIDDDALTIIDAIEATDAGSQSSTVKNAINSFVLSLKAASIWSKRVYLYGYVGGTASSHAINWANPGTGNTVFYGSMTHNSNGITGDGSTALGTTLFEPFNNTYRHNVTLASYVRVANTTTPVSTNDNSSIGRKGSADYYCYITGYSGTRVSFSSCENANRVDVSSPASYVGCFIGATTAANDRRFYQNGSLIGSNTSTSTYTGTDTRRVKLLAGGGSADNFATGVASNENCALHAIFTGLDATECGNLNSAIVALQTALGRNV